jgi:hypothetical protein
VLDDTLVGELDPDASEVLAPRNEWVVAGDAPGPRRWVGNGLVPLLRKSEREYGELVGVDRRGRWLFRKPGDDRETLILDPSLPDPTPKLPFWEYTTAQAFGWDARDYPTRPPRGRRLGTAGKGLGTARREQERTAADRRAAAAAVGHPIDEPDLAGHDRPVGRPRRWDSPPLLVDADGTRYFDGLTSLRVVRADGARTTWPLPAEATGSGTPTLIRTPDGLLFLFNQPGRVLRIRATPGRPSRSRSRRRSRATSPAWKSPGGSGSTRPGGSLIADVRRLILLFPAGVHPAAIPRPHAGRGDGGAGGPAG